MTSYIAIEADTIEDLEVDRVVFSKWSTVEVGGSFENLEITEASSLRETLCAVCARRPKNQNVQWKDIERGRCSQVWVRREQTPHPFSERVRKEATIKRGTLDKKAACWKE